VVFTGIMMNMELLLQKNYTRVFTLLLLVTTSLLSQAQSCVCYQNHFLNDYKKADFIAQIKIDEVSINYRTINEDYVKYSTSQIFKGNNSNNTLFIKQEIGNSLDNSKCRLFVKPGDELIIFAQIINSELITTSCKRNSFIYKNDSKFNKENENLIGILDNLSEYNEQINASSINCTSLEKDTDILKGIRKIKLNEEEAYFGLYNIKFTVDNKIKRIGVVSPFNKEADKKIRIMLIKLTFL